jgi:hypothetical protein
MVDKPAIGHAFELHLPRVSPPDVDATALPWQAEPQQPADWMLFEIGWDRDVVWIGLTEDDRRLGVVSEPVQAVAGFRSVQRRHGNALVMLTKRRDVLVNGRPALPLSVLSVRDCILLGPGLHVYVTERVRPYYGPPPKELLSKLCPFCRIAFTPDTTLVTCRCGSAYHLEPPRHTNADADGDDDQLRCFERVEKCLSCQRTMSLEESLEWEPASAW